MTKRLRRLKWMKRAPTTPSLRQLYEFGVKAYRDGVRKTDCPYPKGSIHEGLWTDGWSDAKAKPKTRDLI